MDIRVRASQLADEVSRLRKGRKTRLIIALIAYLGVVICAVSAGMNQEVLPTISGIAPVLWIVVIFCVVTAIKKHKLCRKLTEEIRVLKLEHPEIANEVFNQIAEDEKKRIENYVKNDTGNKIGKAILIGLIAVIGACLALLGTYSDSDNRKNEDYNHAEGIMEKDPNTWSEDEKNFIDEYIGDVWDYNDDK